MKVTFSPRAVMDLRDIADYVHPLSPQGAAAIERRLQRVIGTLETFPGSGRALEQRPEVRVMPLGRYPYRVFYKIDGDELIILHVRHTARRPIDPNNL